METLADKLALLGRHVDRAIAAVNSDAGASPVLVAVVQEFVRKSKKTADGLAGANDATARELVVEVEQAADSANVAAVADRGISDETRKLVDLAHQAICLIKFESKP